METFWCALCRTSFDNKNITIPTCPHVLFRSSQCTTETVRGPVAILEPGIQRAPPQVKILDPLFRVGTSRPQRMHNGLALSLLDFLLVTAMILITPNDEWMNVTRLNPSDSIADFGHTSHSPSSDPRAPLLPNSEASPEIERWRSSVVMEGDQSQCEESSDDSSSSRVTSRLPLRTDIQSTAQHSTYSPGQGVFSTPSSSSHSLPSQSPTTSQLVRRRTRELPVPPIPPSFGNNPSSATSNASHVSYLPYAQHSQEEPPPMPPLPTTFSVPPRDSRRPVTSHTSILSHLVMESPTSSIHSRSLPTPPTPSSSKPPFPMLPFASPNSAVSTTLPPLPGPVRPMPQHATLSRSQSHSHLRYSAAFPRSPHDYKPAVKVSPNYAANSHISPSLPISPHTSVLTDVMSTPLSICTTGVTPALSVGTASAVSADTSLASEEEDPYDLPPAYSSIDMPRPSQHIHATHGNGHAGGE